MDIGTARGRRTALLLAFALVFCVAVPGTAVAQSESQVGGTVVVEEGETIDELEAFAGTVVVEGTVTGDVSAVGGDVRIDGDVGGDLEAVGGSATVAGNVDGDLEAATGTLSIEEDGTVGGDLSAGAGTVVIDGTVDGNAAVGAETIRLGDDAAIAGDLRYGGTLEGNTDAVAGEIRQETTWGWGDETGFETVFSWLFSAYVLALNLVLGAALLLVFPRFSGGVADHVANDPLRTGLVGLGALVGVPVLLVAIAVTIVGLPISFVGGFAFALAIWIAIVYGRFAVAAWVLSLVDVHNRWVALVVGLVAGALVVQIPYFGSLINLLVLLLGLGALARGLYARRQSVRRRERDPRGGVGPEEPSAD
ncbi:bactofilin family protein [Natrarchaeobius chitinivorans]|uniref:Polymer-forming cytoskeletal protein n=1 Tax=Natrarchaeobius chitinivorans TaxID=1679083 RepID=A0A3N6N879_NATCH|nr:polymer-forming cytoskeletal protein [Natrarchaeobius chitinivorans]RQG94642.1 polymer-forming cytoskeletal protein [Natrarchaeobius chitinivorans]